MSDTITQRDVRHLKEDGEYLGAAHDRVKAFGDRQPFGEAIRTKVREYEAALAEAQDKGKALRGQIEATGDVRA